MRRWIVMVLVVVLARSLASVNAGEEGRRMPPDVKWLCYYGEDRRVLDLEGYGLLILESEAVGDLSPEDKRGRICLAYMSVGEASMERWYWPEIRAKSWILHTNPEWPESRLVDPRSPEWLDLVVNEVAPLLIESGYDGFLLDNVDTAEILLSEDAEKYKGADDAMAGLIKALRAKFPGAVIVANGGFDVVPSVAGQLDAMMYEGTVSTWKRRKDDSFDYGFISPKAKAWLKPRLLRVKKAGLPILALEYVDLDNPDEVKKVQDAVIRAGNNPYLSTRALDVFPGSEHLPQLPDEDDYDGDGEEGE